MQFIVNGNRFVLGKVKLRFAGILAEREATRVTYAQPLLGVFAVLADTWWLTRFVEQLVLLVHRSTATRDLFFVIYSL